MSCPISEWRRGWKIRDRKRGGASSDAGGVCLYRQLGGPCLPRAHAFAGRFDLALAARRRRRGAGSGSHLARRPIGVAMVARSTQASAQSKNGLSRRPSYARTPKDLTTSPFQPAGLVGEPAGLVRSVRSLLRAEIFLDRFQRGAATAADEVARRPEGIAKAFQAREVSPEPPRRCGLHRIRKIGNRLGGRQREQDVNVVGLRAELLQRAAANIAALPDRDLCRLQHFGCQHCAALLRHQNHMVVETKNAIVCATIGLIRHVGTNIIFGP